MARRPRPGAHEALLDAARDEFARVGVERARVEDVCRRAGISKGAFYLHFRTKDDAFREIVQRFLGALEDHARRRHEVEERAHSAPGTGPERLASIFEAECAADVDLLELLWRNRQLAAALEGGGRKGYEGILADFRARMRALVSNRIAERQRAGVLRADIDPEVFADVCVGAYEDFSRRMAGMAERPDLAAWARSFLVIVYEGVLAERAARVARSTSH